MKIASAHHALEIVRALADSPELPGAYYLWHDDEESEECEAARDYCRECAEKALAWLRGGPEPDGAEDWRDRPDWKNCTEDNTGIAYAGDAANGGRYCALCGRELDTYILDIEAELKHFEMWVAAKGKKATPADWRFIGNILNEFAVVESEYFPLPSMRPYEIERDRDLHKRALRLVEKLFNNAARVTFGVSHLECAYSEQGVVWHLVPYAAKAFRRRTLCGILYTGRIGWKTTEAPPEGDLCSRCAKALGR